MAETAAEEGEGGRESAGEKERERREREREREREKSDRKQARLGL